jgi:hypothetical protein
MLATWTRAKAQKMRLMGQQVRRPEKIVFSDNSQPPRPPFPRVRMEEGEEELKQSHMGDRLKACWCFYSLCYIIYHFWNSHKSMPTWSLQKDMAEGYPPP